MVAAEGRSSLPPSRRVPWERQSESKLSGKSTTGARSNAFDQLSKSELRRIDFWLGSYQSDEDDGSDLLYNYEDATVVYDSFIEEDDDEIDFYKDRFITKKLRVIKKDLPLVGYEPYRANRDHIDSWFFMHKFPLKKVRNRDQWAKLVMGREDAVIGDVFKYYLVQWAKRVSKYEASAKSKHLKKSGLFSFLDSLIPTIFSLSWAGLILAFTHLTSYLESSLMITIENQGRE